MIQLLISKFLPRQFDASSSYYHSQKVFFVESILILENYYIQSDTKITGYVTFLKIRMELWQFKKIVSTISKESSQERNKRRANIKYKCEIRQQDGCSHADAALQNQVLSYRCQQICMHCTYQYIIRLTIVKQIINRCA